MLFPFQDLAFHVFKVEIESEPALLFESMIEKATYQNTMTIADFCMSVADFLFCLGRPCQFPGSRAYRSSPFFPMLRGCFHIPGYMYVHMEDDDRELSSCWNSEEEADRASQWLSRTKGDFAETLAVGNHKIVSSMIS